MKTAIGNYLRKLRIKNKEILKDMAQKMGVSSAFLSAVENGKKKMPKDWYKSLKKLYNLNDNQMDELTQADMESSKTIEIITDELSDTNKRLVISFARSFQSIDKETSNAIMQLLNKENKDE